VTFLQATRARNSASPATQASAEKAVREIRRKTRLRFSAEEKIRIVIEGLRDEESTQNRNDCCYQNKYDYCYPGGFRIGR
jgi:transposase